MAFVVLSSELGVDLVNAQGVVTQQNVIVKQGHKLPPNVAPYLISALRSGGVIAFVEDGPIGQPVIREVEPPMQVRTQDLPPVLPSDPVGNRVFLGETDVEDAKPETVAQPQTVIGGSGGTTTVVAPDGGLPEADVPGAEAPSTEKPKASDSKEAWERYAVSIGISQSEAESMTKKDLQAEVAKREQS